MIKDDRELFLLISHKHASLGNNTNVIDIFLRVMPIDL